jgi:hypothetical protein
MDMKSKRRTATGHAADARTMWEAPTRARSRGGDARKLLRMTSELRVGLPPARNARMK